MPRQPLKPEPSLHVLEMLDRRLRQYLRSPGFTPSPRKPHNMPKLTELDMKRLIQADLDAKARHRRYLDRACARFFAGVAYRASDASRAKLDAAMLKRARKNSKRKQDDHVCRFNAFWQDVVLKTANQQAERMLRAA